MAQLAGRVVSVVSLGGAGDRIGALGPFGPTAEGDVELL
jgi:hypothetical protein